DRGPLARAGPVAVDELLERHACDLVLAEPHGQPCMQPSTLGATALVASFEFGDQLGRPLIATTVDRELDRVPQRGRSVGAVVAVVNADPEIDRFVVTPGSLETPDEIRARVHAGDVGVELAEDVGTAIVGASLVVGPSERVAGLAMAVARL